MNILEAYDLTGSLRDAELAAVLLTPSHGMSLSASGAGCRRARGGTDLAVADMLGHGRLDIVHLWSHPSVAHANEFSISCHMTKRSADRYRTGCH